MGGRNISQDDPSELNRRITIEAEPVPKITLRLKQSIDLGGTAIVPVRVIIDGGNPKEYTTFGLRTFRGKGATITVRLSGELLSCFGEVILLLAIVNGPVGGQPLTQKAGRVLAREPIVPKGAATF